MNFSNFIYSVIILIFGSCLNGTDSESSKANVEIDLAYLENDTVIILEDTINVLDIEFDSVSTGLNFKIKNSYAIQKRQASSLRDKTSNRANSMNGRKFKDDLLDSAGFDFTHCILNNIIPHWYGTTWDFEGHTSVPNSGEIACGYFVSTTLRDMGLNIKRYKLAQQAPRNEAISIAVDSNNMRTILDDQIDSVIATLKSGLYFIGLDNHVGYLYVYQNKSYFIHSNYIEGRVMIEETRNSEAFYSSTYYISDITFNKELMKHWLDNHEVYIFRK